MSYDLMVFDKKKRFRAKDDFFAWYNKLIEWSDNIDYNDYRHSTNELQNFFLDMKDIVPPLNGEFLLLMKIWDKENIRKLIIA